jgi:hypothetical protein
VAEDEADVKVEDEEGKTEEGATVEGKGKKQLDGSITSSGGMSIPSCGCAWWRVPSGRRCSIPLRFVFTFFSNLIFLRSPFAWALTVETSDQLKRTEPPSVRPGQLAIISKQQRGLVAGPKKHTTWHTQITRKT